MQRTPVSRAVRLRQVSKIFSGRRQETVAVQDFSMDVAQGEFAVILGPSGCGKSTVVRMIAGLETPSSGSVLVNGQTVTTARRDCSMVFQTYASFPWLSVMENIAFGLRYTMNGSKSDRFDVARRFARMVGLEGFAESRIGELSGGMKQRVAIASALATDSPILLMDEPFGALDSQTRMEMQELLLQIVEHSDEMGHKGKTVIFVTHDIEEALLLGDRLYLCTVRPASVRAELDVPFPHPRTVALRNQREFFQMKHEIFNLLRERAFAQDVERHYESRRRQDEAAH